VLQLGQGVAGEPLRIEDLRRARRGRRPVGVGEARRVDEVDALGSGLDDRRRLAGQVDLDADLLEHLTTDGNRGVLAPLQQPAGQAPPGPVDLSHQEDGGRWRNKPPGAGGLGIGLMARLMDEFETRRSERGTEVWMRRALVGKEHPR